MRRRALLSLPLAASLLGGCSYRKREQAAVFAWYFRALAGMEPLPEALEEWDKPSPFESLKPEATIGLVLESRTIVRNDWKGPGDISKWMPKAQDTTCFDTFMRSRFAESVAPAQDLVPSRFKLTSAQPEALRAIFAANPTTGWEKFHEQFPDSHAIAAFSAAGFSADARQAAFVFERSCGSLCGTGHSVLMAKRGSKWLIEDHRMLWIS